MSNVDEHLKELINVKLKSLELLLDERRNYHDEALRLATNEINRRLDLLNGEAAKLASMQATYLPREVFDTKMGIIERSVKNNDAFRSNIIGRIAVMNVVIASVTAIVVTLLLK